MRLDTYHYSHHIQMGRRQYIVSYAPAGDDWVPVEEKEGTFIPIFPFKTDKDRGPEFVVHEVGKKGRLLGAVLTRAELQRIVDSFQDMLDYDEQQRVMIASDRNVETVDA